MIHHHMEAFSILLSFYECLISLLLHLHSGWNSNCCRRLASYNRDYTHSIHCRCPNGSEFYRSYGELTSFEIKVFSEQKKISRRPAEGKVNRNQNYIKPRREAPLGSPYFLQQWREVFFVWSNIIQMKLKVFISSPFC